MFRFRVARGTFAAVIVTCMLSRSGGAQAPSAKSVKSATDAAALLRSLVGMHQYNDGVAVGAELVIRYPHDTRVRAWYIENLADAGYIWAADSLTANADTLSRDPWVLVARATVLQRPPETTQSTLALSRRLARRARNLAPHDPDIAWMLARTFLGGMYPGNSHFADLFAFVDSVAPTVGNPVELQVMRGTALSGWPRLRSPR